MERVTTYCQASYLLSGKLPTVRQATYCQAKLPTVRQATYCQAKLPTVKQSYLQSGKATYSQAKLPTVRHAPNRSIDMHPKAAYMHPIVSIYMHPTTAYFARNNRILCTQPSHRHAPKRHRHAPKRLHILCTQQPYTFPSNIL